jgi:hypothetical protein
VTVVDVVIVVFGLAFFGLGAVQVATGRNLTSRAPSNRATINRVGGGMFAFLGLAVALNGDRSLVGDTAHGVIAIVLGTGALVFAVWTLLLWFRGAGS